MPEVQRHGVRVAGEKTPFYLPALDGLRGLSFLIVFVSHAGLERVIPGGFGVSIFFTLSGFLIATLLRMETMESGAVDITGFYLRRTFRILPLLYVSLVFAGLVWCAGLTGGTPGTGPLVSQILQFSNYYQLQAGSEHFLRGTVVTWSLAVEEHFYLVYPLLYAALHHRIRSRRTWALSTGAVCIVIPIWRIVLVLVSGSAPDRTYFASDTRADAILWGVLLALSANPVLDPPVVRRSLLHWLVMPASVAVLAASFLYRDAVFRETFRYTLQGAGVLPLLYIVGLETNGFLSRVLSWKPLAGIGLLSYGAYLLHGVVLEVAHTNLHVHGLLRGALALLVTLALSMIARRYVEQPVRRVGRKLSMRAASPGGSRVPVRLSASASGS